jgi:serine phosphatase RsbU (regulator of sigma subunit)/ligand-binding sensor domain-containing protein
VKNIFIIVLTACVLFCNQVNGQVKSKGVPLVRNFDPTEYKQGNQNWAIIQDHRGIIYVGNSKGILEFDGNEWKNIANVAAISFDIDESGRIFVGGRRDFGYLNPDEKGNMTYVSLLEKTPEKYLPKKNYWSVAHINGKAYYTNENYMIYSFDGDTVMVSDTIFGAGTISVCQNELFLEIYEGIAKMENDSWKMVEGSDSLKGTNIRNIFEYGKKGLMVLTRLNGIWLYDGNNFNYWDNEISEFASKNQAYLGTKINDSLFAVGTVQDGVLIFSNTGNIYQHINSTGGMINHDHCAIYADSDGNVWSGLEYGVVLTEVNSPWSQYNNQNNLTNTTFYSLEFLGGQLYAGSAQGVFTIPWKAKDKPLSTEFSFYHIQENKGRKAWDLLRVDDEIICGSSNIGTYSIQGNSAKLIASYYAPGDIRYLEEENVLVCLGEHGGLYTFRKEETGWSFIQYFKDFGYSNFLEIDKSGNAWILADGGVQMLTFNREFDKVLESKLFSLKHGLPEVGSYAILKLFDEIVISTTKGFFMFNESENFFVKDEILTNLFNENTQVTLLKYDTNRNLWFWGTQKENEEIIGKVFSHENEVDSVQIIDVPLRKLKNFINMTIYPVDDRNVLFGSSNQIFHFDPGFTSNKNEGFKALVRKVEYISSSDSLIFGGVYTNVEGKIFSQQPEDEVKEFQTIENSLRFSYCGLDFIDNKNVTYSYVLEGFDGAWSDWSFKTSKDYTNLDPGDYVFKVKARDVYGNISNIAEYKFHIIAPPPDPVFPPELPWYAKPQYFISLFLGFALLAIIASKLYTKRLEAQKRKLESIVFDRTTEIRQANVVLQQQKEEILTQNEALNQQKEEIEAQRDEIEVQRDMVVMQRDHIELQNQEITDSIYYASRIQQALIPSENLLKENTKDYFLIYKPRDIVSGDFYWVSKINKWMVFSVADCTGHGVPGAMMSMLGMSFMKEIVGKKEVTKANQVLNLLREEIIESLQQKGRPGEAKDGMDMTVLVVNTETQEAQFSGANNPLYIINNGSFKEVKGDKMPVAIFSRIVPFSNFEFKLEPNDRLYMFTDGYADQFGGPKGKKLKYKPFKNILIESSTGSLESQKEKLVQHLDRWMDYPNKNTGKPFEQIDDICIMGIEII